MLKVVTRFEMPCACVNLFSTDSRDAYPCKFYASNLMKSIAKFPLRGSAEEASTAMSCDRVNCQSQLPRYRVSKTYNLFFILKKRTRILKNFGPTFFLPVSGPRKTASPLHTSRRSDTARFQRPISLRLASLRTKP